MALLTALLAWLIGVPILTIAFGLALARVRDRRDAAARVVRFPRRAQRSLGGAFRTAQRI